MENIQKIFGIKKGDVVSITGAGGKTSLMYKLGESLSNSLMTTTTKLFVPEDKKLYIGEVPSNIDGSLVVAKKQVEDKLHGFDCSEIKSFYTEFDHTFIEADGARMMSLKGWNATEPIICDFSNKSIGVLDISTLGKQTEKTVFRIDEFAKITELTDMITIQNLVDIVLDSNGLFKNSKFRILYINKVESNDLTEKTFELITKLMEDPRFNLDRIIFGSIMSESFTLAYAKRGVFVLASGMSKRMGQDKLSMLVDGIPLIEHTLKKLAEYSEDLYLVISDNRFDDLAKTYGFDVLINTRFEEGQSQSIKRALLTDYHYYSFFLGDMPYLEKETIDELIHSNGSLVACEVNGVVTAPATLSYEYKKELINLTGDMGAKKVIMNHLDKLEKIKISEQEYKDIDTLKDLEVD